MNLALATVVAVCGFIIGYWVPGSFLPDGLEWLSALGMGLLAGFAVWRGRGSENLVVRGAVSGATWFGVIGFCGGYFGPMWFAPEANLGPLLGILFTGPGGVLLGGIAGAIRGWLQYSD